ncbi:unnamed protein product [Macrosiphum euphorbiae]|uniref:MADF domain-containing protein n=1 Tax=Macrosiphum euphorbiae TaxID=13131 RepID=A0AAV0W101_9HEMI|nr:unnamed protein product [Macrosiphum euphorbiae]CAI6351827.1 unnamed protein product [Macrosiphum euphorbiae]CAI6355750.1 unnamed protein product [Macrosiphum euphorbiae]
MPFDTEQFILEIQQNNCIWDKQAKSHHDLQQLHVGWTNVAKTCSEKFEELDDSKKAEKSKISYYYIPIII